MLDKSKTLYKTENGKLIPQEVELLNKVDDKVETIKAIPIPRKELKKIIKESLKEKEDEDLDKDTDAQIVMDYCVDPKITKEDIEFIKPSLLRNITDTILNLSGLNMKKKEEVKEEVKEEK